MSMEPCPQCGREWQSGQEVCPNCGYRRAAEGAGFRTGMTGVRPMPSMPGQPGSGQPGTAPPPPAAAGAWQGAGGSGGAPPPPGGAPGGGAPQPPPPPGSPAQAPPPGAPGEAPAAPGAYPAPGAAPQAGPGPYRPPAWGAAETARPKSSLRPLALIGALGIILGGPLPWSQFHFEAAGYNLLFKFLFTGKPQDLVHDPTNPSFNIASIGVALIVLGVIALVLSFMPTAHLIRRLAGLLALAIVVIFVLQLLVGDINESFSGLFKDLGPGAYTAFVGGILVLVG
jgi:hypothetical protein